MSRKPSNFVRFRLPARVRRYSHESTTESTVLLLGSFVSPECECRCRVHRLRNDVWQGTHVKFRDVRYLVSVSAEQQEGRTGEATRTGKKEREKELAKERTQM